MIRKVIQRIPVDVTGYIDLNLHGEMFCFLRV